MKKLILFMVMLAITFGIKTATADTLHVPLVAHYGSSDRVMISVTNLSSETATISITYDGDKEDGGSAFTAASQTFSGTTTHTVAVAPDTTLASYSDQSYLFGTTTALKRATVTITSSGEIQGGALFIDTTGTNGAPSGFVYNVAYKTSTWDTGNTGTVGSVTMENWIQ